MDYHNLNFWVATALSLFLSLSVSLAYTFEILSDAIHASIHIVIRTKQCMQCNSGERESQRVLNYNYVYTVHIVRKTHFLFLDTRKRFETVFIVIFLVLLLLLAVDRVTI